MSIRASVNADATNTNISGAGNAAVIVGGVSDNDLGQGWNTSIARAGITNAVAGADQNTTIQGGQGFDTITLGDGNNANSEYGVGNGVTVGSGTDTITFANGGGETVVIQPGDRPEGEQPVANEVVVLSDSITSLTAADANMTDTGGGT